jgi:hypothetical protein
VGWEPRYVDGPLPHRFRIACALDVPALVPSLLILFPVSMWFADLGSFASDVVAFAGIGAFVPILWYAVGWWLDDPLGRFPPRVFTLPIRWRKILVAIALMLSLATLLLGALTLVVGQAYRSSEITWGMLAWSSWLAWISIAGTKGYRRFPK